MRPFAPAITIDPPPSSQPDNLSPQLPANNSALHSYSWILRLQHYLPTNIMGNVRALPASCRIWRVAVLTLLQGAKAAQKRERNQKDKKVAKSQLKGVRPLLPSPPAFSSWEQA